VRQVPGFGAKAAHAGRLEKATVENAAPVLKTSRLVTLMEGAPFVQVARAAIFTQPISAR
jgi:hypothetical protein